MAEGDTILRAARGLDRALRGEAVAVRVGNSRGRAGGIERLDGRRLEEVRSHGKNLLLGFGDLVLHSHLGMNGSWRIYRPGSPWGRSERSAWAILTGERAEAVQFGGPTLRVLKRSQLWRDPQLARLGPDILAAEFDARAVAVELVRRDPSRPLGEALLDQNSVAGIGNIFKSEACFATNVNPLVGVGSIPIEQLTEVLIAARELMLRSADKGRSEPAVYGRARHPCRTCGTKISSAGQGDANRTSFWCPQCQR